MENELDGFLQKYMFGLSFPPTMFRLSQYKTFAWKMK